MNSSPDSEGLVPTLWITEDDVNNDDTLDRISQIEGDVQLLTGDTTTYTRLRELLRNPDEPGVYNQIRTEVTTATPIIETLNRPDTHIDWCLERIEAAFRSLQRIHDQQVTFRNDFTNTIVITHNDTVALPLPNANEETSSLETNIEEIATLLSPFFRLGEDGKPAGFHTPLEQAIAQLYRSITHPNRAVRMPLSAGIETLHCIRESFATMHAEKKHVQEEHYRIRRTIHDWSDNPAALTNRLEAYQSLRGFQHPNSWNLSLEIAALHRKLGIECVKDPAQKDEAIGHFTKARNIYNAAIDQEPSHPRVRQCVEFLCEISDQIAAMEEDEEEPNHTNEDEPFYKRRWTLSNYAHHFESTDLDSLYISLHPDSDRSPLRYLDQSLPANIQEQWEPVDAVRSIQESGILDGLHGSSLRQFIVRLHHFLSICNRQLSSNALPAQKRPVVLRRSLIVCLLIDACTGHKSANDYLVQGTIFKSAAGDIKESPLGTYGSMLWDEAIKKLCEEKQGDCNTAAIVQCALRLTLEGGKNQAIRMLEAVSPLERTAIHWCQLSTLNGDTSFDTIAACRQPESAYVRQEIVSRALRNIPPDFESITLHGAALLSLNPESGCRLFERELSKFTTYVVTQKKKGVQPSIHYSAEQIQQIHALWKQYDETLTPDRTMLTLLACLRNNDEDWQQLEQEIRLKMARPTGMEQLDTEIDEAPDFRSAICHCIDCLEAQGYDAGAYDVKRPDTYIARTNSAPDSLPDTRMGVSFTDDELEISVGIHGGLDHERSQIIFVKNNGNRGDVSQIGNVIQSLAYMARKLQPLARKAAIDAKKVAEKNALDALRTAQTVLLPRRQPQQKNLRFYCKHCNGANHPEHQGIGGDFWWWQFLNREQTELFFCLTDAKGHGLDGNPIFQTMSTSVQDSLRNFTSLKQVGSSMLSNIQADHPEAFYAGTGIIATLNLESGVLEFANFGHHNLRILAPNEIRVVAGKNNGTFGSMNELSTDEVEVSEVTLGADELVLLCSDGVEEAPMNGNSSGERNLFGWEGIENLVRERRSDSPTDIAEALFSRVESLGPLQDDVTILLAGRQ